MYDPKHQEQAGFGGGSEFFLDSDDSGFTEALIAVFQKVKLPTGRVQRGRWWSTPEA